MIAAEARARTPNVSLASSITSPTTGIVTVKAAYESLEGNGARGFSTPLATLHAFQGWADVFLNTPADGVDDASLTLVVRPPIAALAAPHACDGTGIASLREPNRRCRW